MSISKEPASINIEEETLVDRISNLPESLLCHILSFLPTDAAVETSALSRNWLSLWTKVQSFRFIHNAHKFGSSEDFEKFVNMALLINNSQSIDSFELYTGVGDPYYLRTWISAAIDRNVRELDLSLNQSWMGLYYKPPHKLFTCETLEYLELTGVDVCIELPSFVRLPKLKELILSGIQYETDECVEKLLSGCPMLKRMSISIHDEFENITSCRICSPILEYFCLEFDFGPDIDDLRGEIDAPSTDPDFDILRFEIDAPSLKELLICGGLYEDTTIRMENLTSLNKAYISLRLHELTPTIKLYNSVLRAIGGLSSTKSLSLRGHTMMVLSDATSKLTANFHRLTKLDVEITCCKWSALLDFMSCSDSLTVLNLRKKDPPDLHAHVVSWKFPDKVPNCLELSLKEVTFKGIQGFEDEFAMMKYILHQGSILERLQLRAGKGVGSSSSKSEILKKISQIFRKSQQCKIMFLNNVKSSSSKMN